MKASEGQVYNLTNDKTVELIPHKCISNSTLIHVFVKNTLEDGNKI